MIESPSSDHRWLLELVRLLHTTLDVTELLQLFSATVTEYTSHAGVRFATSAEQRTYTSGNVADSICQFQMTVDERPLGTLSILKA